MLEEAGGVGDGGRSPAEARQARRSDSAPAVCGPSVLAAAPSSPSLPPGDDDALLGRGSPAHGGPAASPARDLERPATVAGHQSEILGSGSVDVQSLVQRGPHGDASNPFRKTGPHMMSVSRQRASQSSPCCETGGTAEVSESFSRESYARETFDRGSYGTSQTQAQTERETFCSFTDGYQDRLATEEAEDHPLLLFTNDTPRGALHHPGEVPDGGEAPDGGS